MFFISRPDKAAIQRFLDTADKQSFSYPEVGAGKAATPVGYNVDHNRTKLGIGVDAFERAKQAIRDWKMFDLPWIELCWPYTPIEAEQNVAILAGHFGFYSLNFSRIVYTVDEANRFGFAYGTLTEHVEIGEERFLAEFDRETGDVWYDLLAFSRPGHILARLGYPLGRYLQREFAKGSLAAMCRAVTNEAGLSAE